MRQVFSFSSINSQVQIWWLILGQPGRSSRMRGYALACTFDSGALCLRLFSYRVSWMSVYANSRWQELDFEFAFSGRNLRSYSIYVHEQGKQEQSLQWGFGYLRCFRPAAAYTMGHSMWGTAYRSRHWSLHLGNLQRYQDLNWLVL